VREEPKDGANDGSCVARSAKFSAPIDSNALASSTTVGVEASTSGREMRDPVTTTSCSPSLLSWSCARATSGAAIHTLAEAMLSNSARRTAAAVVVRVDMASLLMAEVSAGLVAGLPAGCALICETSGACWLAWTEGLDQAGPADDGKKSSRSATKVEQGWRKYNSRSIRCVAFLT
jgi:hypothetical protein